MQLLDDPVTLDRHTRETRRCLPQTRSHGSTSRDESPAQCSVAPTLGRQRCSSIPRAGVDVSESLRRCSVAGCAKAAAIAVTGQLFCVEHALERERKLPPPRPANRNND